MVTQLVIAVPQPGPSSTAPVCNRGSVEEDKSKVPSIPKDKTKDVTPMTKTCCLILSLSNLFSYYQHILHCLCHLSPKVNKMCYLSGITNHLTAMDKYGILTEVCDIAATRYHL